MSIELIKFTIHLSRTQISKIRKGSDITINDAYKIAKNYNGLGFEEIETVYNTTQENLI
jgi:hypothetical protein